MFHDKRVNPDGSVLHVQDLKTVFHTRDGDLVAVDGVSFSVYPKETVGIVGESGCGKSVTALSIMRLIGPPGATVQGRQVRFEDRDLLTLSIEEMEAIRGNRIAMIFQEPMTSLNPVLSIGTQISEVLHYHLGYSVEQARPHVIRLLESVGIPEPKRRMQQFPHQLSGGMRQRIMIAMALACEPRLLIADEPTTSLDVTMQAQILDLLRRIRDQNESSMIIITHDLGVVAEMSDKVVVMYLGRVVEEGSVRDVFHAPDHPYTRMLLNSIPRLDRPQSRLHTVPGSVPDPLHAPSGCRFHPRCPQSSPICALADPTMTEVGPLHRSACHFALARWKD